MNKSPQTSFKVWSVRALAACALVASLGAGSFALTYAQGTTPTSTPAPGSTSTTTTNTTTTAQPGMMTTASPNGTAMPSGTSTAATDPTALVSSNSTTTFTCNTNPCDHATISAYLSGIPAGGFSVVQWRDSSGTWRNVDGWQAQLGMVSNSGVPFVQWAVLPNQFNTGPFRWVFYTSQGGAIWGISPTFNLPKVAGTDFAMFLNRPGTTFINPGLGNPTVPTNVTLLNSAGGMIQLDDTSHSDILVYVPSAPAAGWITVQWLDGNGGWHDVEGWQGSFDIASGSNLPFKQWTVGSGQYAQGPFRWVIYNQRGGDVWGVSPNFLLPQAGGLKYATFLSMPVNATNTGTNNTTTTPNTTPGPNTNPGSNAGGAG